MSGTIKKTVSLLIALLFIFSLPMQALAASGKTTVYRTKAGDCYHLGDCHFLGKSKIKTTLEAAINEFGLRPCSVCNPPTLEGNSEPEAASLTENTAASSSRPANGEILYSKYKTKPSTLTFENNTNYDCLVTLENTSNTDVLDFYVRKNKDATVDIPSGVFNLKIAYGSTWKNTTELFGKNTGYDSGDGELDVGKGEDWTFTFG